MVGIQCIALYVFAAVFFLMCLSSPPQLHGTFARQRGNPCLLQCILRHSASKHCAEIQYKYILPYDNVKMASSNTTQNLSDDINAIATFLAHNQVPSLTTCAPVDCIIICASSVLYQASYVFQSIQDRPSLAKTLVLVGGIGHSTNLIYNAVARHPQYSKIVNDGDIVGLPESHVLERILEHLFGESSAEREGPEVLIEDRSTNCGANAVETRKVLEGHGVTGPLDCIVVQDPTMSLRTIASFEKAYEDLPAAARPHFRACPVFVPKTRIGNEQLEYVVDVNDGMRGEFRLRSEDLWEEQRFCELLVGEVARLNDDKTGYGPKGKGFIGHVDVPEEVVQAAKRVKDAFCTDR
jgi:hypothetical protein